MDELAYAGLSEESWRILQTVILEGEVKLSNGRLKVATMDQILAAARYVASLRPPKEKFVNLPEDFQPQKTRGG